MPVVCGYPTLGLQEVIHAHEGASVIIKLYITMLAAQDGKENYSSFRKEGKHLSDKALLSCYFIESYRLSEFIPLA